MAAELQDGEISGSAKRMKKASARLTDLVDDFMQVYGLTRIEVMTLLAENLRQYLGAELHHERFEAEQKRLGIVQNVGDK